MTETGPDQRADCPPWCVSDEDQDEDGRRLHASEWEGTTHYQDGADWHALTRATAARGQAAPPAVQLAVYVDGQEIIVTLTPAEADDLSGAIADSADMAREAGG